jgi:shikimate kinase
MSTPRQIVVIGMMGAGKSTVGRELAQQLHYRYWDNDEALSHATGGHTAAEVQRENGQEALHLLERQLLAGALKTPAPTVFAAPASVVLYPGVVRGATKVWLRVSPATEVAQLAHSGQHHRPLPGDPTALLRQLGAVRASLYARLADITIDVTGRPKQTSDQVIAALAALQNPARES